MHQPNWHDLRIVLAIAEARSIRKAARQLRVSHATVSRHLADLEARLEVRLFERIDEGYVPTPAGDDVCAVARRIEDEVAGLSRRVTGRDQSLGGVVRVTMPGFLTEPVLMPLLAKFSATHPGIEIQLISGYDHLNLSKREADVALRISNAAPADLVGYRLASMAFAVYGRPDDVERCRRGEPLAVVAEDDDRDPPAWWPANAGDIARRMRSNEPMLAMSAIRRGLGIGRLACCIGDRHQELRRLPLPFAPDTCGLWLLTHRDLRRTARIRALLDFMARGIRAQSDLIEGREGGPRKNPERSARMTKG